MTNATIDEIREAIEAAIESSEADVRLGAGVGHFDVTVRAPAFAGKPLLEAHRLVYSAIAHLMEGDAAAVHAIDRLKTLAT